MPLEISAQAPTILVRRTAFEEAGLVRSEIDEALNLTDNEFRVEGELIAIGPIHDGAALAPLIELLERAGLEHYDDFFELSGNWPEWLRLFAQLRTRSP